MQSSKRKKRREGGSASFTLGREGEARGRCGRHPLKLGLGKISRVKPLRQLGMSEELRVEPLKVWRSLDSSPTFSQKILGIFELSNFISTTKLGTLRLKEHNTIRHS